MKTTQQELDELKAKIKELEEKVKEENEFKVGDWIYAEKGSNTLNDVRDSEYIPIFKLEEITDLKWLRPKKGMGTGVHENICRKATESEIKEYLISEAKKRGYTSKNVIKPLWRSNQDKWTIIGSNFTYYSERSDNFTDNSTIKKNLLYLGDCPIYCAGNWAEIVKEKDIEISGYKAKFDKVNKTVSFGCKHITKKQLEAVITVMELNEQFDELFQIGEKYFASNDNEDFSEEISKETIQELIKGLE